MEIGKKKLEIMKFIYNSLEDGWEVRKTDANSYVFKKKHHNDKEIFMDTYLEKFVFTNVKDLNV
jgi:hypothetical protein